MAYCIAGNYTIQNCLLVGTENFAGVGGLGVCNGSFGGGANGLLTLIGGTESSVMFQSTNVGADVYKIALSDGGGNSSLQFRVGSAERMRIACGGNVGIGIPDPLAKLHVEQSTTGEVARFRANVAGCADLVLVNNAQTWGLRVDNAVSNALHIRNFQNNTNIITATTGGSVGIGTSSPRFSLDVAGGAMSNFYMSCCAATIDGVGPYDYGIIGSGNGAGALLINDIVGARYSVAAGSYNLTFRKSVRGTTTACAYCTVMTFVGTTDTNCYVNVNVANYLGVGLSPTERLEIGGTTGRFQSRTDTNGTTLNIRPNAGQCGWISYTEDAVADRWGIGIKNGDAKLYFASGNVGSAGGTTRMVIDSGGCVGINTASPSYRLHVNGTFYAAGSSQDYKQSICNYDTDSCMFMKLKPVTYQYKEEYCHLGKELKSGTQIGLIAEEVAETYPELAILINEAENKVVRNVDYEKLSVILLSEVQKLRREVDDLKHK